MPRPLDLQTWKRRHHYEYFRQYQQPFFNLCTTIDVTPIYEASQDEPRGSFFLATFFFTLKAANQIEPFRYRLRDDGVVVHDTIHGGSTILRNDETFGFAYFDYRPDFPSFIGSARPVLESARRERGPLQARADRDDLVHTSVIPWVEFTSFAHARTCPARDSIPKIVFGKHYARSGRRVMPLSVEVHHALVDGLDVGRYLERLQGAILNDSLEWD